ncbi:hypothetical protein PRZ61_10855 [Halomonas pacifica]|uniref:hypothetical protein n=1 Tax=Bisbaumannia pacifica TaxID=77098 RepID=UPI0023594AB9|nr:hypothetical protein [Halomonas pacifica]MDC8803935.1 hypothetical protein [Halomonas pacifica]
MTAYVNKTLGVVNVGGQFAAPNKTIDVDPKARGLSRLVDRGVLEEVEKPKPEAPRKTDNSKTESK